MLSGWHVHAKGYANEFQAHPDCTIAAVWDEDPQRGQAWAQELNAPFIADLDQLLARDDIDAVAITTPTNLHHDVMLRCIAAGKHIFTEKVLTFTTDEAETIRQALSNTSLKFCISFPHRCNPATRFAKEAVTSGLLGDITYARVRNAHSGASDGWLPETFYDAKACGGGAMMDLGAHPMYLLSWLLGRPLSVSSTFTQCMNKGVDDNAVAVFTYANGAIAVSETAFVSAMCPFILELSGTQGTLLVEGQAVKYRSKQTDGQWVEPTLPDKAPMPIDQFVDGVLHNGTIEFTIDDAVELTRFMESAYISDNQQQSISMQ